ncbi:MAG: hypothetical protein AAF922_02255 [Pseudomonadota bacterium]
MDLLLSLVCGALGGLAYSGGQSRLRIGRVLEAGLGLVGGWLGAQALDYLALGLAHSPAPNGELSAIALSMQIAVTTCAGALLVGVLGQIRRLARR